MQFNPFTILCVLFFCFMYQFMGKKDNKIMIISVTNLLDGEYKILFTTKQLCNSSFYKGLMLLSFRSSEGYLFSSFHKYGRWLSTKNAYAILLLRLFNRSKQNTTSFNQ